MKEIIYVDGLFDITHYHNDLTIDEEFHQVCDEISKKLKEQNKKICSEK